MGAVQHRTKVDIQHMVPFGRGHIRKQPDMGNACVIDQNIHHTEGFFDFCEKQLAAFIIRNIRQNGKDGNSFTFQKGLRSLQLRRTFGGIQHDIIPGAPEGKRNRPADAAGGACYQNGFLFRFHKNSQPFFVFFLILKEFLRIGKSVCVGFCRRMWYTFRVREWNRKG